MVQLEGFELLDASSHTRSSTSVAIFTPFHFKLSFTVTQPITAHRLLAAVDFVADVASAQPAVSLLPLCGIAGEEDTLNSASRTTAATPVCGSIALSSSPAQPLSDGKVLLVPEVSYALTVAVDDLSGLRAIPLKHLLQFSMMSVRLVTVAEKADALATWNVLWQVRRDPQNEQELVRTVLSPLQ